MRFGEKELTDESVTPSRYAFLRSRLEGRMFRHFDGAVYRVLTIAVDVSMDRPVVVLTPMHPSIFPVLVWPLSDFLAVAVRPGSLRKVARFRRVVER